MLKDTLKEIQIHINARYPILYIVSYEEDVILKFLQDIAEKTNKKFYMWSHSRGLVDSELKPMTKDNDPLAALKFIEKVQEKAFFALLDFHVFLETPFPQYLAADPMSVRRKLRDIVMSFKRSFKTLFIISPVLAVPRELEKDITVIDFPLPSVEEIISIMEKKIESVRKAHGLNLMPDPSLKERFAKAALGLTRAEVENVFNKAIVNDRKFDEDDIELIVTEKKQILRKTGLLEYYDVSEKFGNVGGLNNLKIWLKKRTQAFSDDARKFGLPEPKGILLLGVQGCGKSLISKAIAALWKLPLLRFDLGNIFGSYIGQSEENMRKALKMAEALAPTILWIDEIEKGFAGTSGGGSADSGVSKRIFGSFITWMQEKTQPVFIIATANSIENLPPELLRKGRFDEIFFVDLPVEPERKEIFKIHLLKRNRQPEKFDIDILAKLSEGFSGAEIEQAIIAALYDAFSEKRDIVTEDIKEAIVQTVPLSKTMSEQIAHLRNWAKHRARPAS